MAKTAKEWMILWNPGGECKLVKKSDNNRQYGYLRYSALACDVLVQKLDHKDRTIYVLRVLLNLLAGGCNEKQVMREFSQLEELKYAFQADKFEAMS